MHDGRAVAAQFAATRRLGILGLHDIAGADRMLARATQNNPESAAAFGLWAAAEKLAGDQAAAALYFRLSWRDNEPLVRNEFSNPEVVTFH